MDRFQPHETCLVNLFRLVCSSILFVHKIGKFVLVFSEILRRMDRIDANAQQVGLNREET